MNENISVSAPGVKIVSAWVAVGITSWTEAAAATAMFYSLLLIGEWFWKKFWRDFFVRLGWLKPRLRRRDDHDDE